ncbi:MAG: DUF3168 domain-containing protein [Eubacteriales bacterium]
MSIFDLQKKIYTTLNATALTETAGVYDFIPESASLPYVVIGDDKAEKWNTKTSDGWRTTSVIHIWGEERSMQTVKKLLKTVETLLSVDLDEFKFDGVSMISAVRYDVEFVHGTIELNYKVEEE